MPQASPSTTTRDLLGEEKRQEGWRWGRRDLLALAAVLGLCIYYFWPLLTPDRAQRLYIVGGDFTNQFYPYHFFAAAEWWAKRIPLWNPYMFGGHPFQADIQTAVFYPLALLVNLVAGRGGLPFRALEWQGVVDYLLAATFTYLFLRVVIGDRVAAMLGAVLFALGGYLTSYPYQQLAVLETSIWLPLILLLLEIGVRRPRHLVGWWLGAALALAVALLAGHPQSLLFTSYTAGAYLVFRAWTGGLGWRRTILGALAFGVAAAGSAAVQLLPTIQLTALSTRAAIPYDIAASGYNYVALPGLLMPAWREEQALYLGIAPLLLALGALRRGPRRAVWFWGIVAIIALALSFGDRGILYRLFHAVAPGFAMFKDQERTAFIFSFAGAVLASYGLAALRRGGALFGSRALVLLCAVLAALGAVGIFVYWPLNDVVSGSPDLVQIGYPRLVVLLLLSAALIWLAGRGTVAGRGSLNQQIARGATVLLVILAAADVLAANWHNNMSSVDPTISPQQQAGINFLKAQEQREGEPLRVRPQSNKAMPANYGSIAGLPFASGDSPIVVQRTQDLFGSPQEWRLWQLLNVKYVVGYDPPTEALQEVYAAPPFKVYRNLYSLPRAWVVENTVLARNAEEAKDLVLAQDFVPGKSAVVEERIPLSIQPAKAGEAPLQQQITFNFYSPRRLYLHTTTNRAGLLVLSEAYYPGWQAKLDGVPVPIYHADYMLRGIALPAGEHRLEMVYNPPIFWAGLAMSGASLLVLLGVWLALWRRDRRASAEGKAA